MKAKKKKEIEELFKWQPEIEAGNLAVFMIDECHLLWGDLLGYTWGRTEQRIKIPMKNQTKKTNLLWILRLSN